MRSPTWFLGWHAPLFKLTKALIIPNRDDSHALHRLVDDLFAQLQETFASDVDGPAVFRTLLIDVAVDFDRAPRGAALETLQSFGVPSGTPFWSIMRSFRVVIACTADKGRPLTLSPEMALEVIHIHAAKQYLMLMPVLFPGNLATRKRPDNSLATSWTIFALLKHNTSPAMNVDALPQFLSALDLSHSSDGNILSFPNSLAAPQHTSQCAT